MNRRSSHCIRYALRSVVFFVSMLTVCVLQAQSPMYVSHWTSSADPDLSTGTAGSVSTITIDTACSQVKIEITDPTNAPLPPFNAYTVNPEDSMGADITDLSGNMRIYARARSVDTVKLAMLLRSGGGTSSERTDRVEVTVPGDSTSWSEFEFVFDASNLGGFDSTDFRDIWVYLDRGTNNFAGNEFYLDYVAIGAAPDMSSFSSCPASPPPSTAPLYSLHWASGGDPTFTGTSVVNTLTQTIDPGCSQIGLTVNDTAGNPLNAFAPFIINPEDAGGADIVDMSNNMRVYARVRSRDSIMFGMLLRSGDGTPANRSTLQQQLVPGDTANWSSLVFVVDASNIGGFDSTDMRDVWFFLDRGTENFAGNEVYIDYISLGAAPDTSLLSICPGMMPPPPPDSVDLTYFVHWDSGSDPTFTGSSVLATSVQTIDTVCSQLGITVTDPDSTPLNAFAPLILNPRDSSGAEITDITGNLSFHVRVRSKAPVMLGFIARAADGTSAFRSTLQEQLVPGDSASWTMLSFDIDSTNIGGFDPADLRDLWFYLDRGTENFAGNEFYFDYISIGDAPDTSLNSICFPDTMGGNDTLPPVQYTHHWNEGSDPIFTGASAATLSQTLDSTCSQLAISVTDTAANPLLEFQPLILNPLDSAGFDIVDISGSVEFHVRVRSRDSVMLGFLARSGDGTAPNRSIAQEQLVPGDTMNWTELTFVLDTSLGGFDSTNLRDIWFNLDRGALNFAGNEFYFDYVAIGEKPDPADNSPCSLFPAVKFPYVLHWADTLDGVFTGSGAAQLTQSVDTACSQLQVTVTDPVGDPHGAFKPLIVNPKDEFGNDIRDLSGQMTFYTRVRSAAPLDLGMILRAGDGTSAFRSEVVVQSVPGDLTTWTDLTYTFTGADYGGFDSTDMRDFWFYLNREEANFPGNEFYFDYVSIGSRPDSMMDSECVETVGIEPLQPIQALSIYPNPSQGQNAATLKFQTEEAGEYTVRVFDVQGRLLHQEVAYKQAGLQTHLLQPQQWTSGLYMVQLIGARNKGTIKWMID
ncbi:MAG: T9SS type A sorting domain-containing protein [Bacteroidota bacterium]